MAAPLGREPAQRAEPLAQRLKASGRLDQIFDEWFPEEDIDFDMLVPVYDSLYADERVLADFNADMPYPASSVMDRIEAGSRSASRGCCKRARKRPRTCASRTG